MTQQQSLTPAKEECTNYNLTAAPCVSDLSIMMIGIGGLLWVVSHPFALPVLVCSVGFQKK